MKSRITAIVSLLLLALLPSLMALDIQPKPPGPVITTGNANLRAKPSMSAEILVSLKKDAVLVARGESMDPKAPADEPSEWVEVTAPTGAKVWVFAALVDPATKTIRPAKANLRAGPGRNYAEVGHALQGTVVQELRSSDGWIQIAAPEGSVVGYIAKSLTKPAPEKTTVPPVVIPPAVKPPASTTSPALATTSPSRRPVPLPAGSGKPSISPGRSIPIEKEAVSLPLTQLTTASPAPSPLPAETVAPAQPEPSPIPEPAPAIPATEPTVATSTPEPTVTVPAQPEITHTDKPRVVIREGIVGLATSPQAPGDYQLNNFRKGEGMIGFLHTDNPEIKISSWRWRRVLVTGEEYIDARWPKSALTKVTAIQPAY